MENEDPPALIKQEEQEVDLEALRQAQKDAMFAELEASIND